MNHRLSFAALGCVLVLAACTDDNLPTEAVRDLGAAFSSDAAAGGVPRMHVDPQGNPYVPGQLIVRFTPGAAGADVAQQNRGSLRRASRLPRVFIVAVPEGEEAEVRNDLRMNPNVEFAELDYAVNVIPCGTGDCTEPGLYFSGRKWDHHNTGTIIDNSTSNTVVAVTGKAGADMDWLEAFEYLGPDFAGSAVIAILDSGIRDTHGDLAGKVIAARNFATGYPEDFIEDRDGHGTHVAGIAAASGNLGVHGVAWGANVRVINAKVCERYLFPDGIVRTSCPSSGTADAIVWATDLGANVLNLSIGGSWTATAGFPAQQLALQYARARNVLPFCSAGNDGNVPGYTGTATSGVSFPARFPECVAVASTDWFDGRSGFSSWGPQVELSAPGGQVFAGGGNPWGAIFSLSNSANNTYTYKQGTSMAAPQAAGLAALLFASGQADASDVLARMKETADDLGPPGHDPEFGIGRINVYRALTGNSAAIALTLQTRSTVNVGSNGVMAVTVLARDGETFSLDQIRLETVRLGSTPVATRPDGTSFVEWTDVDGDGVNDLVLHFDVPALRAAGLTTATTSLTLGATLTDARRFRGTVEIRAI
jgi:subtilisin family serine protease